MVRALKNLILAVSVLAFSPVHAELLEVMSSAAYFITDGACPGYDQNRASEQLTQQGSCRRPGLTQQAEDLARTINPSLNFIQDRYFAALAHQHALELGCAADYAASVAKGNAAAIADLKEKFKLLRDAKQKLVKASMNLASNGKIMNKVCPMTRQEVEPDRPAPSDPKDSRYRLCMAIIINREAHDAIYNSIAMVNLPSVKALAEHYANADGGVFGGPVMAMDKTLDADIRKAYLEGETVLRGEAKKLNDTVATSGGAGFDRGSRHALISDPAVVTKVMGQDKDMQGLACQANAEYGKGADNLEMGLMVGSIVFSGGVGFAARGLSMGMKAAVVGRSAGMLSVNALRVMQAGALTADATALFSAYSSECGARTGVTVQATCVSAPKVSEIPQDGCMMAIVLNSLGFVPLTPIEKIGGWMKKFKGEPVVEAPVPAVAAPPVPVAAAERFTETEYSYAMWAMFERWENKKVELLSPAGKVIDGPSEAYLETSAAAAAKLPTQEERLISFADSMGATPSLKRYLLENIDTVPVQNFLYFLRNEKQSGVLAFFKYNDAARVKGMRSGSQAASAAETGNGNEIDQLMATMEALAPNQRTVSIQAALKEGQSISIKVPDGCDECLTAASPNGQVTFNKFFAEHLQPHTGGLDDLVAFRKLEDRMAAAQTVQQRQSILEEMKKFEFTRKAQPTSFSAFESDLYFAPQRFAGGRDFVRATNAGSMTETFEFTSDVHLNVGGVTEVHPQRYRISICKAPPGQKCQSGGKSYESGEVASYYPTCGDFVLRYPSMSSVKTFYVDGKPEKAREHSVELVRCP